MNPLTNVRNLTKANETELNFGIAGDDRRSWHAKYKNSAWIFVGGLPFDLTEGDVISVFSQYGEIVNVNLIRDKKTGKSRGFCFVCFEDQRSTTLAVDNFNGIKLVGRTIRVDHVENYRVPKEHEDMDEETKRLYMEGCAPEFPTKVERSPQPDEDEESDDDKKRRRKRSRSKERRERGRSDSEERRGRKRKRDRDRRKESDRKGSRHEKKRRRSKERDRSKDRKRSRHGK